MKSVIIPSIIATNQKELDERISKVASFARVLQLDVMDSHFVRNMSLMFDFTLPKRKSKKTIYEAHLMMENPIPWIHKHHKQVDVIIVHYESKHFKRAIDVIRHYDKKVGVALNPNTLFEHFENLDYTFVDTVLVMTVHPGKYGAAFLPSMVTKVKEVRKKYPKVHVEADGSMNDKTVKKLHKAGANKFVVGSYLQKSDNVKASFTTLKKLIN